MELLGRVYRIVYESKNLKPSITGIVATVLKPDGNTVGPITLEAVPGMPGVYRGGLSTTLSDPEGQWIGFIQSPNENNFSRGFKVSFIHPDSIGGGGVGGGSGSDGKVLVGVIKTRKLTAFTKNSSLTASLNSNKLSGVLLTNPKLVGKTKKNKLTGVLKCKN